MKTKRGRGGERGRTGRAALTAAMPAALRVRSWLLEPRCGPLGAAGRRAAWRRRGPVATLPATQLVPLLDAGAVLQRPCAAGRRAAPRRRTAHRRGASHGARPAPGCQSRAAAPRCAARRRAARRRRSARDVPRALPRPGGLLDGVLPSAVVLLAAALPPHCPSPCCKSYCSSHFRSPSHAAAPHGAAGRRAAFRRRTAPGRAARHTVRLAPGCQSCAAAPHVAAWRRAAWQSWLPWGCRAWCCWPQLWC